MQNFLSQPRQKLKIPLQTICCWLQHLKLKSSQSKIHYHENGPRRIFQKSNKNYLNLKTQAPIDVNIPPHKLLEVFFDDEMINCLCDQSKIYANSKGNFTLHVTPDKLRAFLAILLISGYTSLQRRRVYWEQVPDVFNYTVSDMLTRNRFEEILRYLHLADDAN